MMITHDVDEAVLLSDRIVMLTNGPNATIGEILDADLPRPPHTRPARPHALLRDPPPDRRRAARPPPPARLQLAHGARFLAARASVLEFLHARHAQPTV